MVDAEDVESVAENARINLDEEEKMKFSEEFEEILEMFDALDQIDTSDVEPAFHPVETDSRSREDEEEMTLGTDDVFRNTGNKEEGFFKGPSA